MLNPFFQQGSKSEQSLVQDLINEQLKIYGIEIYYMPRKYITEKTVMREVIESKFDSSYPIEAYVQSYEGYDDNSTILSKFGIQNTNEVTLVISKERFNEYISPLMAAEDNVKLSSRPKEGDILYFPLGDRLFEIKQVIHDKPFYQLQENYTYELRCELFRYEDEIIDTGVDEIDDELQEGGGTVDGGDIFLGRTLSLTMVGIASTATAVVGGLRSGAIRLISVTNRGGGYLTSPTVAISSAPTSGVTGIASAILLGGIVACDKNVNPMAKVVQSVQMSNAGLGYTQAPTVSFTSDTGSGAAAVAVIDSGNGGQIGIVTITSGGSGYSTANPTVIISTPKHVGAAATATIDFPIVGGGVSVTNATVSIGASALYFPGGTTGGVFYKTPPTITFGLPTGTGNAAEAEATLSDISQTGGTVETLAITTGGKFYISQPTVVIPHPGTSSATATIGLAGTSIDPGSIAFSTTGRAYTTAPTVTIYRGIGTHTPYVTAVGFATIHPITGIVTAVGFNSTTDPWCVGTGATIGLGYTVTPTISFTGSPSPVQATASVTVSAAGTVNTISIGNSGYGYQTTPIPTIASPAGADENFRALGIATMRVNSVKIAGTIGIGSDYISGITTDGIIVGDRVRLQYHHEINRTVFPTVNFISTDTYVADVGYGTVYMSQAATNVGIATTAFEFGIDQCGIVTGITVTYGGGGYLSVPTVTISNDPSEKNYVELMAGIHTAKGVARIDSTGTVVEIDLTDSGANYILHPTITVAAASTSSNSGMFQFNEIVTGSITGNTAVVRKWNLPTNTLEVSNMSGDFSVGETLLGSESGASYSIRIIPTYNSYDGFADNNNIEIEADKILDFSESNPFGNA
jgi:hypothetical protein